MRPTTPRKPALGDSRRLRLDAAEALRTAARTKTIPEVVVVEAIAETCPAIRADMVSFRLTKDGRLRVVFFEHPRDAA